METDEGFTLTVKLFHSGVRSIHDVAVDTSCSSVRQLKALIQERLEFPAAEHSLVLVHCGRKLRSDSTLSNVSIKPGSCINVIARDLPAKNDASSSTEGKDVLRRLFSPSYLYMTKTVLSNPNTVNEIASTFPSLQGDLVAQGILKDFNILTLLVSADTIDSLLEKHPCLSTAAIHLSHIVIPKADKDSSIYTPPAPSTNRYALDAMSDDEEEPAPPPRHTITAGQLSAAIAQAQSSNQPVAPANSPATATPPAGSSFAVTPAASGASAMYRTNTEQSTPNQAAASSQPAEQGAQRNYDSQLEQLYNMGISDRTLALRALETADGNVSLALDIIYGGEM